MRADDAHARKHAVANVGFARGQEGRQAGRQAGRRGIGVVASQEAATRDAFVSWKRELGRDETGGWIRTTWFCLWLAGGVIVNE